MKVSDFYRLELHWASVEKNKDNICKLSGAYFCGPVLKHAERIAPNDNITIDLTPQYARILSSYYFTKLTWKAVTYQDGFVYLNDVMLDGDFINEVSNLGATDYIVIDTSKHDGDAHLYNLVYRGAVVNKTGEEYLDG